MIETLKSLLGIGPNVNLSELVQGGAQIIDVRTKNEFQMGHIKQSINIPLHELPDNLSKLKKDTPIITCCASGMRSATAKGILKAKGFKEVYNGGGWLSLQNKIK